MKGTGWSGAPLSLAAIRETAHRLLGDAYPRGAGLPQQTPVEVQMALGALRGLDYRFRRLGAPPIDATTYMDWYSLEFAVEDGPDVFLAALDPALASGAHALAFPPEVLNRAAQRAEYERNGVTNFPDKGDLWYTDGGTIDNHPLGRALDMTDRRDESFQGSRLHLLIIPDPSFPVPADSSAWADRRHRPFWVPTVARAGRMAMAQTLYDDLRRTEKTNSRLKWSHELINTLAAHLAPAAAPILIELIEQFEHERSEELGASSREPPGPPDPDEPIDALVRRAMVAATGLQGKHPIAVDAISPLILGAKTREDLKRLLSGDRFGHFFGFLERRLRSRDFALGYRCMLAWLDDPDRGLRAHGIAGEHVDEAVAAAAACQDERWIDGGGFSPGRVRVGAWTQVMRVSLRAARLAGVGFLAWRRGRRRRAAEAMSTRIKRGVGFAAEVARRPWPDGRRQR